MTNKLAQEAVTNPAIKNLQGETGVSFFQKVIPALVTMGFVIGAIIFTFMLLSGAITWITSGSDKNAVEAARGRVTSAIVGIVVLFVTFAVINLIGNFFGINILDIDLGSLYIK